MTRGWHNYVFRNEVFSPRKHGDASPGHTTLSGDLRHGWNSGSMWTCPHHNPRSHHRRLWSGTSIVGGFRVMFKKARWKNILCQKTLTYHSVMEKGQKGYHCCRESKFTARLVTLQTEFKQVLMRANPSGFRERLSSLLIRLHFKSWRREEQFLQRTSKR